MTLRKILLIDDEQQFHVLHKIILRKAGIDCEIVSAFSGGEALRYIASTDVCPDVILSDIEMPGMNGLAFLSEYAKMSARGPSTKVYMVSASLNEAYKVSALSYSFVRNYFDKPLSEVEVREILSDLREQT